MVDTPTPPRRRWFQDNPHAIIWIGLILLIFGGIAALATLLQPAIQQRSARLRIEADGGEVAYENYSSAHPDYPFRSAGNDIEIDFLTVARGAAIKSDASAQAIRDLPGLTNLWFDGSQVTDNAMGHLEACSQLIQYFYTSNTQISAAGANHLKNMPCLTNLRLNGGNINDEWLEQLARNEQLQLLHSLNLSDSRVTDEGVQLLKTSVHLSLLDLSNTNISDASLEYLKELTKLSELKLSNTKISDVGLESLEELNQLQHLLINNTLITDSGLEYLAGFHQLRFLNIDDTKVTREGVERFKKALPECNLYWKSLKQ